MVSCRLENFWMPCSRVVGSSVQNLSSETVDEDLLVVMLLLLALGFDLDLCFYLIKFHFRRSYYFYYNTFPCAHLIRGLNEDSLHYTFQFLLSLTLTYKPDPHGLNILSVDKSRRIRPSEIRPPLHSTQSTKGTDNLAHNVQRASLLRASYLPFNNEPHTKKDNEKKRRTNERNTCVNGAFNVKDHTASISSRSRWHGHGRKHRPANFLFRPEKFVSYIQRRPRVYTSPGTCIHVYVLYMYTYIFHRSSRHNGRVPTRLSQ